MAGRIVDTEFVPPPAPPKPRFGRFDARLVPSVASLAGIAALIGVFTAQFHAWPTDAYTYLAAAERLNAGHTLYALEPGDRPIGPTPDGQAIPLLSPPLIAVLWRPLALLPPEFSVAVWQAGALAGIGALVVMATRARPIFGTIASLVFALPMSFLAVTGNVNSYLLMGMVAAWILRSQRRHLAVGMLVGLMAAVKLFPGALLVWLLACRHPTAVAAAGGSVVALLAVSLTGAGLENHAAYLDVARSTAASGQSAFSLTGIALAIQAPPQVAHILPLAAAIVGLAITWIAGRSGDEELSFVAAVFTAIWASPIVNFDWLALMFAALAPGFWPLKRTASSTPGDTDLPTPAPG